jgi:AcrR family transcriptional regulator
MNNLTPKAECSRLNILNTALALFSMRGYEAATMRDIAAAAHVSLGLAYRYFDSKESLVLALYQRMAEETDAAIVDLAPASITDRFLTTMKARLAGAERYRRAFSALFGAIMTPGASASLLGSEVDDIRRKTERAFINLVENSKDALKPSQARDFGKMLCAVHFAIIFFWLHDRSQNQKATQALLEFIRSGLPVLRQGMRLRVVSAQLARFVRIMEGIFGSN